MLRNKRILLIIIFTALLFLIPSICKAEDTFTTEDGIVATKIVQSNNGDIEIKFSNIELSSEGSYTWAIGRTSLVDEIEYSANLGDFSELNKTALISLTTSQKEIWSILRENNTAYIFIKDEKANQYIVNALKIDLTLPLLKAFKVTKNSNSDIAYVLTQDGQAISYNSYTGRNNPTKATYDIANMYFKFVKITDENIISNYHEAIINGTDLENLSGLPTIDEAPDSGWKTASKDGGYNNTKIKKSDVPTDRGLYCLWLKGKDADSKTVFRLCNY